MIKAKEKKALLVPNLQAIINVIHACGPAREGSDEWKLPLPYGLRLVHFNGLRKSEKKLKKKIVE